MKKVSPPIIGAATAALMIATIVVVTAQDRQPPKKSPIPVQRPETRSVDPNTRPGGNVRRVPEATPRPSQAPEQERPRSRRNTSVFPMEFRTIDGTENNLAENEWGAAEIPYLRVADPAYEDGASEPSGDERPNPRDISNAVIAQEDSMENSRRYTDFLWQWGQWIDHDIDETPTADPEEPFNIAIPAGEPLFDPFNTGTVEMSLNRSKWFEIEGVREQENAITAFIDCSNVYGSDEDRADALRIHDGTGRLKTSEGNLLPFNEEGFPNAGGPSPTLFLAGDVRANEQVGLTAMHTLWMREHNYWAGQLAVENPEFDGEQLYQHARAIVIAENQAITYREWLPLLVGRRAMGRFRGYQEDVNPSISNEFAGAAFRLGHSMLSSQILRLDAEGNEIEAGHLSLAGAFFRVSETVDHGIDPTLRGMSRQICQDIDHKVVDSVRNFLFGPPGAGGFDLASLNIQRGRDHGFASYNAVRVDLGLSPVTSFEEINPRNPDVAIALASVYDDVNDIDLWVGGLVEPHARGAVVGETFQSIISDQFRRIRDGDRFWYEGYLPRKLIGVVNRQRLSTIIRRNTDIGRELHNVPWRTNKPIRVVVEEDSGE